MKTTAAVCILLCIVLCTATVSEAISSQLLNKFKTALLKLTKPGNGDACKSVAGTVDSTGDRHFVHICETDDGSGVCVSSKLERCCPGENIWNCSQPVSSVTLQVGRSYEEVVVSLYPVKQGRSESLCFLLDESHHKAVDSCGRYKDEGCKTKDTLVTRCLDNVAEDEPECSAETNFRGLKCKEGFKAPSCCSCDDGYVQMYGECIRFCPANCKERDGYPYGRGCRECRPGYQTPDCCECADNYYKADDGACKAICTDSALECSENGCTKCKAGYKGKDCCELELAQVCAVNCIGERPDGTCRQCRNGALPPHCCQCAENYRKTDTGACEPIPTAKKVCAENCDGGRNLDTTCVKCKDNRLEDRYCCDCKEGYEKTAKGECRSQQGVQTCMENCQRRNRFTGACDECYFGFANPLCCTCEEGYEMMPNGDCEMRSAIVQDIVEAVEEALRGIA